ncbi:MAG: glycine cleavage system protein H [Deltaproteobacteria bacterium]|nr:glycine cleavage system protein H [Deltaproteobacteria bacterium]MBW2282996.1 glycine cleavage system protein H [Deltaproteobacteria bacterium]
MADKMAEGKRDQVGYGSSYEKGSGRDLGAGSAIGSVLGGQVWLVKPDKKAKTANPCIWMQAGVAEFKNCNNFYDCTTCKYDLGMHKKAEKGAQFSWRDAMRRRPGMDRVCRHSLTHRIEHRVCAYDYECGKCDFDQFFEDVWTAKMPGRPYETQTVKGFEVPMGYYFHNGHTWVRIESGGTIRVGMDDFTGKVLGGPDALELPLMGKELDSDSVGWGMKRKDNLADVLSPIGGVITEVNGNLREKPALSKERPYEDGWLFMVHTPDVKGTVKKLMTDTDGLGWMEGEVGRLETMIEEVAGPLAADGGLLVDDIYGNLPDLGWKNLTKAFLKTE